MFNLGFVYLKYQQKPQQLLSWVHRRVDDLLGSIKDGRPVKQFFLLCRGQLRRASEALMRHSFRQS